LDRQPKGRVLREIGRRRALPRPASSEQARRSCFDQHADQNIAAKIGSRTALAPRRLVIEFDPAAVLPPVVCDPPKTAVDMLQFGTNEAAGGGALQ
jgi:hypothetical protein